MYVRTILYVCKQYKCMCSAAICTRDMYVRCICTKYIFKYYHMYVSTINVSVVLQYVRAICMQELYI